MVYVINHEADRPDFFIITLPYPKINKTSGVQPFGPPFFFHFCGTSKPHPASKKKNRGKNPGAFLFPKSGRGSLNPTASHTQTVRERFFEQFIVVSALFRLVFRTFRNRCFRVFRIRKWLFLWSKALRHKGLQEQKWSDFSTKVGNPVGKHDTRLRRLPM